jgi:hypothetical protein
LPPIYPWEGWVGSGRRKFVSDEEKDVVTDVNPEDVLGAEDEQADLETQEPADSQPTETASEEPPELATEEPAEPVETVAEPAPETVPYKVSWGGQEFELAVTPEQAKVLDSQRTTALQFPHLQQRYQEVLNASRQAAQVASVQPHQTQPGPEYSPQAFVEKMQPVVQDAVKRGAISEEFSELYPVEAAGYAFGAWKIEQMERVLSPLFESYQQSTLESQRNNFRAEVYDRMQHLASENPDLYGDLNDHTTRERYLQFMTELNLEIGHLQGDNARQTLERLWPSFQGPQLIQAAKAASDRAKAQQSAKRQNASGGGGGGGQRTKPKSNVADIEAILGD